MNVLILKKTIIKIPLYIIVVIIFASAANSQNNQGSGNSLNSAEKTTAINSISTLLFDNYIFPDVSKEMEKYINTKLKAGDYDSFSDPVKFAEELTKDLQSVSKDKHIRVQYNPEQIKKMKERGDKNDEGVSPDFIKQMKSENFGFKKVEILNGNIGYIDFRNFGPGEYIKDKVADVMGYVEDCDALIFDMRYNGGGDPTGIQVISSYLFQRRTCSSE